MQPGRIGGQMGKAREGQRGTGHPDTACTAGETRETRQTVYSIENKRGGSKVRIAECDLCGHTFTAGKRGKIAESCPDCRDLWNALQVIERDLPGLIERASVIRPQSSRSPLLPLRVRLLDWSLMVPRVRDTAGRFLRWSGAVSST